MRLDLNNLELHTPVIVYPESETAYSPLERRIAYEIVAARPGLLLVVLPPEEMQ